MSTHTRWSWSRSVVNFLGIKISVCIGTPSLMNKQAGIISIIVTFDSGWACNKTPRMTMRKRWPMTVRKRRPTQSIIRFKTTMCCSYVFDTPSSRVCPRRPCLLQKDEWVANGHALARILWLHQLINFLTWKRVKIEGKGGGATVLRKSMENTEIRFIVCNHTCMCTTDANIFKLYIMTT